MLTAADGETIARKLGAIIKKKSRRHKIAVIRINGKEMARSGFVAAVGNKITITLRAKSTSV